jgi:GT2 family glycosyltransferase
MTDVKNEISNVVDLLSMLQKRNWQSKLSMYKRVFSSVEILNEKNNPEISIVIISWKFNSDILNNLLVLQSQNECSKEIIFVDNGSENGEMAQVLPYVDTYVRLSENTGAYLARNIGSLFSNSDIIIFLDDDAIPADKFAQSHLKAHNKYDVIAVRGAIYPKTDNPLNKLAGHYYLGDKAFPVFSDIEGNVSYNSKCFFETMGWDDEIIFGGGGVEYSRRLIEYEPDMRKQIYFPEAIIFHDYARNENHITEKKAKQEKSKTRLRLKYPDMDQYLQQWNRLFGRNDILIIKEYHDEKQLINNKLEKSAKSVTVYMLMHDSEKDIRRALYSLMPQKEYIENIVLVRDRYLSNAKITELLDRQNIVNEIYTYDNKELYNLINNSIIDNNEYSLIIKHACTYPSGYISNMKNEIECEPEKGHIVDKGTSNNRNIRFDNNSENLFIKNSKLKEIVDKSKNYEVFLKLLGELA